MKRLNLYLGILAIAFLLLISSAGMAQVDNMAKNRKMMEDADAIYKKDLEDNPNSALPHWAYANTMAAFTFNAYKGAWKFYLKALEIDSTNADIYYDFSNYLAYKLDAVEDAKKFCERGLSFTPNNQKLKDNVVAFEEQLNKQHNDELLYAFDTSDKRFVTHDIAYDKLANVDSLAQSIMNSDAKYQSLLNDFNTGKSLSDYDVYRLLAAYTYTPNYSPYRYDEIMSVYNLADQNKLDEAIKAGEALLPSNPLNPSLNRVLMFCYRKKGDTVKGEYYHKRVLAVLKAMLFSGDGTCEKPYMTFWVKEEYNFALYIGLEPTGAYKTLACPVGMADHLETYNPKTKEKETIVFNIMAIYSMMMRKTSGK